MKILIPTTILFVLIIFLFVSKTIPSVEIDPYANYDFDYVLNAASINKTAYIENLTALLAQDNSFFAKGDAYLIIGRLTKDKTLICDSIDFYSRVEESLEEKALAYETIASLGCKKDSREYYLKASKIWNVLGNKFRSELDKKLANKEKIDLKYKKEEIQLQIKKIDNWNVILIGNSSIELYPSSLLVSQTDRVSRDWLSAQIQKPFSTNLLTTFSERFSYNQTELLPEIGWHEGARIKELMKVNVNHKIASGTIAARINNKWYAPDEKGVFRFEIPDDKIKYPTTRFLTPNIAIVIDTHGINMLVEQAIRYNASAVIGCCDHPDKIKAAKYLSEKGISVICLTDRFVPDLLFSKADILGSPSIKITYNKAVLGKQPISITKNEKIIAMDIGDSKIYAIQYYDTPARYFKNLEKTIPVNVEYVKITDFNQIHRIIDKAEEKKATVIAVRIFNSNDYNAVKDWLEKDKAHKAILFHSVSYPYGYKLLLEFPKQTTFDDINPEII